VGEESIVERTRPSEEELRGQRLATASLPVRRGAEEEEEEEFFNHYKNNLKRHAHPLSVDAGADL